MPPGLAGLLLASIIAVAIPTPALAEFPRGFQRPDFSRLWGKSLDSKVS